MEIFDNPDFGNKIGNKFGSIIGNNIGSIIGNNIGNKICNKVGNKIGKKIGKKTGNKISNNKIVIFISLQIPRNADNWTFGEILQFRHHILGLNGGRVG